MRRDKIKIEHQRPKADIVNLHLGTGSGSSPRVRTLLIHPSKAEIKSTRVLVKRCDHGVVQRASRAAQDECKRCSWRATSAPDEVRKPEFIRSDNGPCPSHIVILFQLIISKPIWLLKRDADCKTMPVLWIRYGPIYLRHHSLKLNDAMSFMALQYCSG
ncbi:hypothetical protein ROA7450_04194 [Roseovarius albus]|uniref:Uncharacterized protein n=1 Tax=Roseovarius albus TaxID=1247867 RepID=A0A1X7AAA3_9RHOB|nr:hypothetical protein ROA7450_04194 [Roseovarius albus]